MKSNNVSIVNITQLRDTEQSLLSSMLLSFDKYLYIKNELTINDFTFEVHGRIFNTLCKAEKRFNNIQKNNQFDLNLLNETLLTITEILDDYGNLEKNYTLKILTSSPSFNLEHDINLIHFISEEKELTIKEYKDIYSIMRFNFEDSKNSTTVDFLNNKVISIYTENVFELPLELCETVSKTMEEVTLIDLENEENLLTFSPEEHEPVGITIFTIKKELSLLKIKEEKFSKLFSWADKYNIDEDIFPREVEELEKITILDLSNKNIKELPDEIYLLKSLKMLDISFNEITIIPKELFMIRKLMFLCFKANNITEIPKEIEQLKRLNHLCFCNNKINLIPDNLCTLKTLNSFCIHGNKLNVIPEKISEIKNLETFSISNNNISSIPNGVSFLKNLKSFQFENNNIQEVKSEILNLPNLNELAFDDKHLQKISENFNLLKNINTINLTESNIDINSNLIQKLSLVPEFDEWMDKEDRRETGCIKLSRKKEDSNEI